MDRARLISRWCIALGWIGFALFFCGGMLALYYGITRHPAAVDQATNSDLQNVTYPVPTWLLGVGVPLALAGMLLVAGQAWLSRRQVLAGRSGETYGYVAMVGGYVAIAAGIWTGAVIGFVATNGRSADAPFPIVMTALGSIVVVVLWWRADASPPATPDSEADGDGSVTDPPTS